MEMEHINENTIRVLIKGEDLAARGFTFLDLLGNKDEIESFFYSILEEVDVEEEFKGSEAVTFQVMPKGDGLELFISKSTQHDLSETFESFRREHEKGREWFDDEDQESEFEDSEDEDELEAFLRKEAIEHTNEDNKEKETSKLASKPFSAVFEFINFEVVIWLANEVSLLEVETRLYEMNRQYYLELEFLDPDASKGEINNVLAVVSEFAAQTTITPAMLMEHGEVVMNTCALESVRSYFPNH